MKFRTFAVIWSNFDLIQIQIRSKFQIRIIQPTLQSAMRNPRQALTTTNKRTIHVDFYAFSGPVDVLYTDTYLRSKYNWILQSIEIVYCPMSQLPLSAFKILSGNDGFCKILTQSSLYIFHTLRLLTKVVDIITHFKELI